MRPLARLTPEAARAIDTVVFDLDDTLLDHGRLTEVAYAALFRLRDAGLSLVASTGRPAGWAELIARQWPLVAALAENGAVAWSRAEGGRLQLDDPLPSEERARRRARLSEIAAQLLERYPELGLADDVAARHTDLALDIGEHRRVPQPVVEAARALARSLGARTFASSVHMHLTFEGYDKASGYARWASAARGDDPARALRRAAFLGDSGNDAPAFAAFGLTFGVANVRAHLSKLTVPPRYVATRSMGEGFAEIAAAIVERRG